MCRLQKAQPRSTCWCLAAFLAAGCASAGEVAAAQPGDAPGAADSGRRTTYASGPLRVSKRNPRYFEDSQGRIVYLTGMSASVVCLADKGREDPPYPFDFPAYLAHLQRHNGNLVRMWTREQVADLDLPQPDSYIAPLPWARTGPGLALDGKPKFDLTKFDEEYFARMRQRAAMAGRQGIYMSIMLFEGHGHRFAAKPWGWSRHPFNVQNNVNGIDGDPKNTGGGQSLHTLDLPKITALQEAYVRHVIDTVNNLDNVLYEISNEDGEYSKDWQDHWIRLIHKYETGKPKQHPVGMTFAWMGSEEATNRVLFESEADWISPLGNDPKWPWKNDPPAGDGRKVVLVDTDHLWGVGGNVAWV